LKMNYARMKWMDGDWKRPLPRSSLLRGGKRVESLTPGADSDTL
jgi:hypothetical protein